jgi:hypothetical protein
MFFCLHDCNCNYTCIWLKIIVAGSAITRATVKGVKYTYPQKYITPGQFRRIIPSQIFSQEIWDENGTLESFLENLAILINTSVNVCNF